MRTLLVLLFALTLNSISFSQDFSDLEKLEIDSINQVINNPKTHDTVKASSYLEKALYYYIPAIDSAIKFCDQAKTLSEANNFDAGKAESYAWLGFLASICGVNRHQYSSSDIIVFFLRHQQFSRQALAFLHQASVFSQQASAFPSATSH